MDKVVKSRDFNCAKHRNLEQWITEMMMRLFITGSHLNTKLQAIFMKITMVS